MPGPCKTTLHVVSFLALLTALLPLLAQEVPAPSARPSVTSTQPAAPAGFVGSETCRLCHETIYETYSKTAMANASGPATQELIAGEFEHAPSRVHYRVFAKDGKAWFTFDRPGDATVHGTRQLLYYIGSGHRGRSYLFDVDGFVFESPINWYAQKRMWDMAPAYQSAHEIPMNLPALPGCLSCHTSNARKPAFEQRKRIPAAAVRSPGHHLRTLSWRR